MESRSNRVVRRPRTIEGRAEGKPVQESKVTKSPQVRVTESRPSQVIRRPRTQVSQVPQVPQVQIKEKESFLPVIESIKELPIEARIAIVNNMDCAQLKEANLYPEFRPLINSDIIRKAINRGYPRPEGKYKTHYVDFSTFQELKPYYEIYNLTRSMGINTYSYINDLKLIGKKYNSSELNDFISELIEIFGYDERQHLSRVIDSKLNDKFYEFINRNPAKLFDLVKGDFIEDEITGTSLIYDGCKFISVNSSDKFKVLENGVPVDYWAKDKAIATNFYGKIDISPYLDEILDKLEKESPVSTKAKILIDGREWDIFFPQSGRFVSIDDSKNKIINKVKEGQLGIVLDTETIRFKLFK
jgi:hypothetical protein